MHNKKLQHNEISTTQQKQAAKLQNLNKTMETSRNMKQAPQTLQNLHNTMEKVTTQQN